MEYDVIEFLMEEHGCTRERANDIRTEMRGRILENGEDPDDVLLEEGMELDYLESLLETEYVFRYQHNAC